MYSVKKNLKTQTISELHVIPFTFQDLENHTNIFESLNFGTFKYMKQMDIYQDTGYIWE